MMYLVTNEITELLNYGIITELLNHGIITELLNYGITVPRNH